MKNIILAISMIIFGGSFTDTEDIVDINLHGVWQEATENEFVRMGFNSDFETTFQRVYNKQLVASGLLETKGDSIIKVTNNTTKENYNLQYVFSYIGTIFIQTIKHVICITNNICVF